MNNTAAALVTLLVGLAGFACSAGGPPNPEAINPVTLSGPRGSMGGVEVHNEPSISRETVTAAPDAVWGALPAVYRELEIAEAGADTAQLVYGAVDFTPRRIAGHRLSRYIDCGMGLTAVPKADEYAVTMSVLTRLAPGDGGTTVVTTSVIARAKQRGVSGNPVYCQSKGMLEAEIIRAVVTELSRGS